MNNRIKRDGAVLGFHRRRL